LSKLGFWLVEKNKYVFYLGDGRSPRKIYFVYFLEKYTLFIF
jgi:hypothetical protein